MLVNGLSTVGLSTVAQKNLDANIARCGKPRGTRWKVQHVGPEALDIFVQLVTDSGEGKSVSMCYSVETVAAINK